MHTIGFRIFSALALSATLIAGTAQAGDYHDDHRSRRYGGDHAYAHGGHGKQEYHHDHGSYGYGYARPSHDYQGPRYVRAYGYGSYCPTYSGYRRW